MALTVDHLRIVRAALFKACTKWYDIGLELKVPVNTLDSIKLDSQYGSHSDKLRETLKVWLKTAKEPLWQDVVGVLKRPVVGEPKLASDIEAKYCTTAEAGQASGSTMPEVQPQPTTRGTELHTLQQALQDSRELRDKDKEDSQRRIHTLQQELQTKDQQLQDSQGRMHTLQQELQDSQGRTHTLQQELQDSQGRTHTLQRELQDSQGRTHTLQEELQKQIDELTHQVEKKNQRLENIEKDLLQREQTIGELRAAIDQLKRQLQQAQQQAQHATEERERQVRELSEQLLAMKQPGPPPQKTSMQQQPRKMPQVGARPHETITPPRPELQQPQEKQHATGNQQLNRPRSPPRKTVVQEKAIRDMKWKKESKAPEKMCRGSVAADANMAYFNGADHRTVHSYDSDTQEWRQLPDTPHTESTLVVVDHILTMVGGQISGRATDSLLNLMGEERGGKWLPNLPVMPTKRYNTSAVCSDRFLIVAGGQNGSNYLATVEVLDTDTRQWSVASSLTHPFSLATISICGERLYILGSCDQTGYSTRSVLSCSVSELLQSCQTQPLAGKLRTAPANQSTIWRQVADAPHKLSSCATLCGQLVAVGGWEGAKYTSAITVYNETTDSWKAMGRMPTARSEALVATLNEKILVVGGWAGSRGILTDVVEILC